MAFFIAVIKITNQTAVTCGLSIYSG